MFFYRSGNPKTLKALGPLIPVPEAGLLREFGDEGLDPLAVCVRTLTALGALGIHRVYLCNLPAASAVARLEQLRRQFP